MATKMQAQIDGLTALVNGLATQVTALVSGLSSPTATVSELNSAAVATGKVAPAKPGRKLTATVNGCRIEVGRRPKDGDGIKVKNKTDMLWLHFPAKPDAAIRKALMSAGFFFTLDSKSKLGWWYNGADRPNVKQIAEQAVKAFAKG